MACQKWILNVPAISRWVEVNAELLKRFKVTAEHSNTFKVPVYKNNEPSNAFQVIAEHLIEIKVDGEALKPNKCHFPTLYRN